MKKWVILAVAVVVCAIGVASYFVVQSLAPIPPGIKRQLSFTLLLPGSGTAMVDKSTYKYNSTLQLLTFDLGYAGVNLVVSEEPTPDTFSDIPQYYPKLIDSMNNYATFDSNLGTVYLTQPSSLNGKQAAVLNTKGTLLFAKPNQSLTESEWRQLFVDFAVAQ